MKKGKCAKWFMDHGSRGESFPVYCRGQCKPWCLVVEATWTYKGFGIGVCENNVGIYGPEGLASLLIHEAAHHYCPLFFGRESCAEEAQDACKDEI